MDNKTAEELKQIIVEKEKEITQLKEQLEESATTDQLTGLLNKNVVMKLLELEINKVERSLEPFSLIMINVADFTSIREGHGVAVSNEILAEIGNKIQAFLRKQDIIAKWGNKEFLVVLPETNKTQARNVEDALKQEFKKFEYMYKGEIIGCNIKTGIAKYNLGETIEECLGMAETEMNNL